MTGDLCLSPISLILPAPAPAPDLSEEYGRQRESNLWGYNLKKKKKFWAGRGGADGQKGQWTCTWDKIIVRFSAYYRGWASPPDISCGVSLRARPHVHPIAFITNAI